MPCWDDGKTKQAIAAFGNSDGDLQMLQWIAAGRLDKGLDEAKAKGWKVVDMKNDWNVVFPK